MVLGEVALAALTNVVPWHKASLIDSKEPTLDDSLMRVIILKSWERTNGQGESYLHAVYATIETHARRWARAVPVVANAARAKAPSNATRYSRSSCQIPGWTLMYSCKVIELTQTGR